MKVQFFLIKHSLVSNSVIYCGRLKCTKSTLLPSTGNSCRLRWRLVCYANGFRAVSVLLPHSNVCSRIPACGSKSGVCQVGVNTFSAGMANSRLHFADGVLYLNLSGGADCHHVQKKRETIISFVCSSGYGSQGHGKPVFVSENDCTYYITWHTSLVCERQVGAQVTQVYIPNRVYINSGPSCVCRQKILPAHHSIWDCCLTYFGFGSCYELVWIIFHFQFKIEICEISVRTRINSLFFTMLEILSVTISYLLASRSLQPHLGLNLLSSIILFLSLVWMCSSSERRTWQHSQVQSWKTHEIRYQLDGKFTTNLWCIGTV